MSEWTDLSDLEINRNVAEFDGGFIGDVFEGGNKVMVKSDWHGVPCYEEKDYCNNWSDMAPLIIKNKIALHEPDSSECDDVWSAGQVYGDADWYADKNPLRAAAIVFLIMNGVKPCSQ